MFLFDNQNAVQIPAVIKELSADEFDEIEKGQQFSFEWNLEKDKKVFKICPKDSVEKLGLMSIIDLPEEFRIHIELIEVSIGNTGRLKKIDRIAGCLIAFACKMAFSKGYGGFISLIPKTLLIDHYKDKFGFKQLGRQLGLDWDESKYLIKKFLDNEKI